MSDVKLQDWPEGVRLRITYWHDKEEPGRCVITSYAGEWHFFEPVSVEIEPHPEGFYVPARDYDRQAVEIARLRARLKALVEALGDTIRLFAAERNALQKRGAELEAALKDAAASVKEWGAYASQYLQDKWDLSNEVARYIAIAEGKNDAALAGGKDE